MPFSTDTERAMRPLVTGRRNWTFAGSDRGAENAATIMTIVETAKANDLNPQVNWPPFRPDTRLEQEA